jgi:hypothetical protein
MTVSSSTEGPTTGPSAVRPATRSGWARREPLIGVAFVVLFVAGFATMNTPNADESNKKWVDFFASSGNQIALVVSAFLFVLAGLCLLWFLTMVWSRAAAARRPEAASPLPLLAAGAAAVSIAIGKLPEPRADILRVFGQISFPLIAVAGMIAFALALGALSLQARRAGVFGKGLTIFSLIVAVVALFSFIFFPMLLVLVWFLVASAMLFRRQPTVSA